MGKLCLHSRRIAWYRAEVDSGANIQVSGFSFAPNWGRTLPAKLAGSRSAVAALGLMGAALNSPSHAQTPPLGTAASFGVLAGSTVTNTGPSVITGNLGVSPGSACTGFTAAYIPPCSAVGFGIVNGAVHAGDAVALQAQSDDTTAYLNLKGRPFTADFSGVDLGGKTLIAGVYFFSSSAALTGPVPLTLNGQGNPNSVFIFNITSQLTTTGPGASISLINGAQASNVFWRVGSSATLGTGTTFLGDILALTSISLNTGITINCGAVWAQTGAVTLDDNTIKICSAAAASASSALPISASDSQRAVANAIDNFIRNGGTLPPAFQNLLGFLSPSQLADALAQLSGEAGTGAAQAGTEAMNSFLSLVTNPFANNRGFAPERRLPPAPSLIYKAPYKAAAEAVPDPRRWGIWAAGYGGQSNAIGDPLAVGSHDRSVSTFGYATGLDYLVTPDTVAGFALAGGGTRFGLSDGFGGGHSDMFQAAVYSMTRADAAYVSAALAYGWHHVSTDRVLTVAGGDQLTADFFANDIGARIEGGYRFAIPGMSHWPGRYGFTPYAAGQAQAFRTPSYSESAVSGSSDFALAYDARTTDTARTELGAWFDWSNLLDYGTTLSLRARAAWAHDYWSAPNVTAMFVVLPGSSFTVTGAAPASDSLLASAGAEIGLWNGFSLAGWFDGEFADQSRKYAGTGRLRYTW
jgi:outer membrane autotransporter protein